MHTHSCRSCPAVPSPSPRTNPLRPCAPHPSSGFSCWPPFPLCLFPSSPWAGMPCRCSTHANSLSLMPLSSCWPTVHPSISMALAWPEPCHPCGRTCIPLTRYRFDACFTARLTVIVGLPVAPSARADLLFQLHRLVPACQLSLERTQAKGDWEFGSCPGQSPFGAFAVESV